MPNFKEKLKKEIQWADKIIYILSWIFIVLILLLIALRYVNGWNKESFWPNFDYFLLFFILLDLLILNRVSYHHSGSRFIETKNPLDKQRDPSVSHAASLQDDIANGGLQNEKFVFGLIVGLFVLNLLWMVDLIMNKSVPALKESVFLPYRLNYIVLILGLILLTFNRGPLGLWLKGWLLKFKDPRAFIALALVFFVLCPFSLIFKQEPIAEKAANMAYFLLVIGILGQFAGYIRESRQKLPTNNSKIQMSNEIKISNVKNKYDLEERTARFEESKRKSGEGIHFLDTEYV
jgi:hypothetical protein